MSAQMLLEGSTVFQSGLNLLEAAVVVWCITKLLGRREFSIIKNGVSENNISENDTGKADVRGKLCSAAAVAVLSVFWIFFTDISAALPGGSSGTVSMGISFIVPVLVTFLYSLAELRGTWRRKFCCAVLFTVLIPLFSLVIQSFVLAVLITLFSGAGEDPGVIAFASSAGILVIYLLLCFAAYVIWKQREMQKMEEELLRRKYAVQERDLEEIRGLYLHLQKVKHDAKHHIRLLEALLESGKTEEARAYLKEFSFSEQLLKMDKVFSSNTVVNYLINLKSARMQEAGIRFSCSICDRAGGIADVDLNILLGNLFDNAIEACERVGGEREIFLAVKRRGDYLVIIMENTAGENVLFSGSEKPDPENHGYGISSMKEVAERYGGRVHMERIESRERSERTADLVRVSVVLDTIWDDSPAK